jgi:histidine ammonia-lyase
MNKTIIAIALGALGFAACSSDYAEALANAKIHACQIQEVSRKLATNPGDPVLATQIEELRAFLENDREMSGDADALQQEIAAHLAAGCK